MKITKGSILEGTNPFTGEVKKYKYVGRPEVSHSGFDRELIEGGTRQHIIVGKQWCKEFKLRVVKYG